MRRVQQELPFPWPSLPFPFRGVHQMSIQKSADMASSKKWASIVSSFASLIYFLLIFFQIPLFRVPCRIGICTTPIQVTSSQLIASEFFPAVVVKALLYPGAIAHAIMNNTKVPSYSNLLNIYSFNNAAKEGPATTDLEHLEILAGSYLTVAGAVLGVVKPGRMSLFGTLLIIWGLVKEVILNKSAYSYSMKSFDINQTMFIALVAAFLSIKGDVRKLIRCCRGRRVAKHSRTYLKAKHK